MKTTKRFLMLLLAVCLCVGLMTVTASATDTASGSCGDDLSWTLSADGTLTISGSGAMTDYSWLDAPWLEYSDSIRTVVVQSGVTTLCDNAFYDCDRLTSVSLPNTLTTIGYRAFGNCNALGRIQLPDSVTSLDSYVFSDCSALTSVILPDGISQIPSGAFSSTGLTSIAIPDSVTVIGSYAFNYCPSLTSVSLPSGLELIEECAFAGCNAITSITVPAGAKLESGALPRCVVTIAAAHPDYSTDSKGVLFNKDKTVLIQAPLSLSGSYTIPGTVQRIEPDAFTGCTKLTGVTIPNSVTEIGYGAFCYSGLKSVNIPASVTSMDGGLFYNCDSLTTATILAKADTLSDSMFEDCDNLTTVTLPEGLVDMGGYTFFWCTKLKSVNIPSTVTTLGYNVFEGCTSLESVTIPAGVTEIYEGAFQRCTSLKAITVATGNANYCSDSKGVLYNKAKTILMQAPGKLSGAYTIPASVTTINNYAFFCCTGLESVNIPSTVTTLGYSVFEGCTSLKSVTIPASVTSIHHSAFSNTGLTAVTIPAGVTELDGSSFGQCPNLTKITVAEGNPNYSSDSNGALYNKDKTVLYTVPGGFSGSFTIPNTVTELSWSAFYGCNKVTAVTIPGTLETVYGFWGCTGLKTVTIKSGVKTIDYAAFQGCSSLESVSIPASVTSIANNSFDKCPKLSTIKVASGSKSFCTDESGVLFTKDMTQILFVPQTLTGDYTIPGTVTNINEAFSGSQITSLTVPGSVTEMSGWVFKDCTKLKSVTIGSGVTELAYGAFRGCTSLTNVDLPDTLTTIPWDTFTNCTGLKTITIPEGVTTIESYAFDQCTNLKNVVFAGDAPVFDSSYGEPPFVGVKASAWYPAGNTTWTTAARKGHGGTLSWISYKPLAIKSQPTGRKVKAGTTVAFGVKVSGPAPTYQWQFRTGANAKWQNATATGNKTATLKVPATTAKSGYQYRCVITDALGNTVTTKAVYLYVLGIKTQPTAKNVKEGVVANFTVNAAGHNKTFQWQYKNAAGNWVNATAPGAKTATLKVTAKVALNGRMYRCVIKDSAGNQVISNAVKLTVFGVKTQPVNKTVARGVTAKFTVAATGSGLKYQWQYKNANGKWVNCTLTGSKTATLSVKATAARNGMQYRCRITDSLGRVIFTNAATLKLK